MSSDPFSTEIARHIWETKYRYQEGDHVFDTHLTDTWHRIAKALAAVETRGQKELEEQFYKILEDFKFLPGGRIQAGAGVDRRVTLFNCFVMGTIDDSLEGIFDGLKEGALTMQQGGGVGYDFSTLRPKGTSARGVGAIASGPVSFMKVWNSMCATMLSTGTRRGAMMATLRCDHPDIEGFIEAKQDPLELRHFNLSVLVTDTFMEAVRKGRLRERELWDKILKSAYDYAEPGVLFIDKINRMNNLGYREKISATNPCGEIPLPPYGACNLGSINLTKFVNHPFSDRAEFDWKGLETTAQVAVRMLDNVIDVSRFPLASQRDQGKGSRRIGLGVTGLADALIMLKIHYGDEEARRLGASVLRTVCHSAYRTSIELAKEKGEFTFFEREKYLQGEFIRSLPDDIRAGIREEGIRNSHLIAIAPAGTISLLAGNVSSGIEPVYAFTHSRRVVNADRSYSTFELADYAWHLWTEQNGTREPLPEYFIDSRHLSSDSHLGMQSALQPYVDNSISKTINIPEDFDFEEFKSLYDKAFDLGLKGCTVFRNNPVTGEVLRPRTDQVEPVCCP